MIKYPSATTKTDKTWADAVVNCVNDNPDAYLATISDAAEDLLIKNMFNWVNGEADDPNVRLLLDK